MNSQRRQRSPNQDGQGRRNQRENPGNHRENRSRAEPSFDLSKIVLVGSEMPPNLFSAVAEDAARYVAEYTDDRGPSKNSKPTQLRKFYDEICMWDGRVQTQPGRINEYLPFILMLKAKVAYSKGRGHLSNAYENVLNRCLSQVEEKAEPQTLHNLKLFMEAFTGFYKVYCPK